MQKIIDIKAQFKMERIIEKCDEAQLLEIDKGVKNKFRWEWLDKYINVVSIDQQKTISVRVGDFIKKVDKALCTVCSSAVIYGSRGFSAISRAVRQRR